MLPGCTVTVPPTARMHQLAGEGRHRTRTGQGRCGRRACAGHDASIRPQSDEHERVIYLGNGEWQPLDDKGWGSKNKAGLPSCSEPWEPAVANRSRFPEITAGLVDVDPAPRERWSSEGRQRREDQRGLATPSNHGIGSAKPYQNAASTGSQASASTAPSFISCQTMAANALAMTAARRMRGVGG